VALNSAVTCSADRFAIETTEGEKNYRISRCECLVNRRRTRALSGENVFMNLGTLPQDAQRSETPHTMTGRLGHT
jgi:hypothetical protein